MKATIVVNMDGSAFGPNVVTREAELIRVLRLAANHVESIWHAAAILKTIKLVGSTGQSCGRLTVSR